MLNKTTQRVEQTYDHMENVNTKMKETLEEVGRSSDKMCVDIMCIVSAICNHIYEAPLIHKVESHCFLTKHDFTFPLFQ